MSRLRSVLAISLLVMVLILPVLPVQAANLTGGLYTYVINGEEVRFAFDPVPVRDGLLLPDELFKWFGITIEASGRQVHLSTSAVAIDLALGTTAVTLNGQPAVVETAPLRLNERLFLPGGLLQHFGVGFTQDGLYVIMHDYGSSMPPLTEYTPAAFADLKRGRTITNLVKADSGIFIDAEFLLLSPELVGAANLPVSYGTRVRMQSLLTTNTLVMVTLSNSAFKDGAMVASGLHLADEARNQYDLAGTLDTGKGSITATLIPFTDRTGILLFPRLAANAGRLSLYYEPNGAILGAFDRS